MKGKLLFAGICIMLCGIALPSISVSAEELEEKVVYFTDEQMQEIMDQMVGDIITTFSTKYNINWTVKANKMVGSQYFHKDKGQEVAINVTSTKTARVGILGMNGVFQCLDGTTIEHVYKAKTSQSYCVCVYNMGSSSLDVSGFYVR